MNRFELVIAGGGLTAARAMKSFRDSGGRGRIALLAGEDVLPYHRPALSKRYLQKLLIATGARPRRLTVPGAELVGVYALRTLRDSDRIRQAAQVAEHAIVVGGGFIGLEAAASLRQLGLNVTLIHLGTGLFDQFGAAELSRELASLYRDRGVTLLLEEEVAGFGGEERLEYVETKSGACIEADLAVVGVGVVPNIEFLTTSGLALDNGIVVNERFEIAERAPFDALARELVSERSR